MSYCDNPWHVALWYGLGVGRCAVCELVGPCVEGADNVEASRGHAGGRPAATATAEDVGGDYGAPRAATHGPTAIDETHSEDK